MEGPEGRYTMSSNKYESFPLIQAVRLLRWATGCTLRNCKEWCDQQRLLISEIRDAGGPDSKSRIDYVRSLLEVLFQFGDPERRPLFSEMERWNLARLLTYGTACQMKATVDTSIVLANPYVYDAKKWLDLAQVALILSGMECSEELAEKALRISLVMEEYFREAEGFDFKAMGDIFQAVIVASRGRKAPREIAESVKAHCKLREKMGSRADALFLQEAVASFPNS